MSDHDDLTPPAERPMPEAARARVRAEVVAGTDEPRPRDRRWVMPLAAAAALLAVVAATGLALTRAGGSPEPRSGAPAAQATESPTPAEVEPSPESESQSPTESAGPATTENATPCDGEVGQVLRGARAHTIMMGPVGRTTFYVAGNRYVLCDDSGGNPTVHAPHTIDPAPAVARDSFKVSDGIIDTVKRHYVTVFVGGGLLPTGVRAIEYRFPDGHVEPAEIHEDGRGRTWWRMVYVARTGVITEPGTNQLDFDPITVHVEGDGAAQDFTLRWALDTCAQVNHGC